MTNEEKSTPRLVGDLVSQVTELFRKEVQLLRAEFGEKLDQVINASGMLISAVVLSLVALNVLAAALVVAIGNAGLGAGWASLIVGATLAVIALALAVAGSKKLKASRLSPKRTTHAVASDVRMAKEKV